MSTARCFFLRDGFLVWFSPWFPAENDALGDHFPEGNEEEEANDFQTLSPVFWDFLGGSSQLVSGLDHPHL